VTRADKRARQKERSKAAREAREAALKRGRRKSAAVRVGVAGLVVAIAIGIGAVFSGRSDDNSANSSATTTSTATDAANATDVTLPEGCAVDIPPPSEPKQTYTAAPPMTIDPNKTYTAKMTTTCGEIEIALDTKNAPQTVNSFVYLAHQHFYDGLKFHRVAKDFVVQGGDPKGDGTGGPGYTLPDEPPPDGYKAGSVAMANAGPGTTGSQFFLTWTDQGAANLGGPPYLYSTLGTITNGLDVVAKLGTDVDPNQNPSDPSTQTPPVPIYILEVQISES
jgi:cyclophilin family peptidyl-prolyl cis-trans isomerase